MTRQTIGVNQEGRTVTRVVVGVSGGFGLVVMAVVTEMGGMRLLMLTVCGCRCPSVLERQDHQQKEEEKRFHGKNNSKFCALAV